MKALSTLCYLPSTLFVLLAFFCTSQACAQPQWRFHLAFEDATGAKDTIWFIYDTTATVGWGPGEVDHDLGEGAVAMDLNAFNVWTYNWDGDSTKTIAKPYTWFPLHGEQEIYGFNYQYPITIRWDRSLLHADYLPDPEAINTAFLSGQYFYWHGNDVFLEAHSILEEDSVVVGMEALWDPLFPMSLFIAHLSGVGFDEQDFHAQVNLIIRHPQLQVEAINPMEQLRVHDISGRLLHDTAPMATQSFLNIADWPAGLYIVRVRTSTNSWHHGKFIKVGH